MSRNGFFYQHNAENEKNETFKIYVQNWRFFYNLE